MIWRSVFLSLLLALAGIAFSKRLPRSFTPTHYCSACRAISFQFSEKYKAAPAESTIDSGSFRLSGSGKQKGLQKVPIRQTEFHAGTVIEQTCNNIESNWVIFEGIAPAVFVRRTLVQEEGLEANATTDSKPLRSLPAVCDGLLDEHYDELVALVTAGPLADDDFLGEAPALCDGETGLFRACAKDAGDEQLLIDVLAEARVQLALQEAADASGESAEEKAGTGGGDGGGGNSSGLSPEGIADGEAVLDSEDSASRDADVIEADVDSREEL